MRVLIKENHPTEPTSPSGLDKLYADHYTRIYHDHYDLETVALRYFNVYGPAQTGGDYASVISIDQALSGDDLTVDYHGFYRSSDRWPAAVATIATGMVIVIDRLVVPEQSKELDDGSPAE